MHEHITNLSGSGVITIREDRELLKAYLNKVHINPDLNKDLIKVKSPPMFKVRSKIQLPAPNMPPVVIGPSEEVTLENIQQYIPVQV